MGVLIGATMVRAEMAREISESHFSGRGGWGGSGGGGRTTHERSDPSLCPV